MFKDLIEQEVIVPIIFGVFAIFLIGGSFWYMIRDQDKQIAKAESQVLTAQQQIAAYKVCTNAGLKAYPVYNYYGIFKVDCLPK